MDGWIEVPYYGFFFLSTPSTIISLKLVADAAHAGIIICSLKQQAGWGNVGPIHVHTTQAGGCRVGSVMGCDCVMTQGFLKRLWRVLLSSAGHSGAYQTKGFRKIFSF